MLPKERVLTTFHHGKPDRVPIDYSANPGIDAALKARFGLAPEQHQALLDRLSVDFRHTAPAYTGPRLHAEISGLRVDPLWGIHYRRAVHASGDYWDPCDFPLKEAGEEEIARWPLPSPDDFDYPGLADRCRRLDRYAVSCHISHEFINFPGRIRSMEEVLVDLATDNPAGLLLLDRIQAVMLEVGYRALEAAKGAVAFVVMGQDLGTQRGPIIGMNLFRRHIRPRLQKYVDLAKSFNLPVMLHSCGSSSWAFEDLIEMGIDCVDTLQPEAADMAPEYLVARFGGRLAFHGCISTAGPVSFGTVEEVVEDVRRTLAVMMTTTGYCFSPTHMLQDNSPVDNILAMYETALRCGRFERD